MSMSNVIPQCPCPMAYVSGTHEAYQNRHKVFHVVIYFHTFYSRIRIFGLTESTTIVHSIIHMDTIRFERMASPQSHENVTILSKYTKTSL